MEVFEAALTEARTRWETTSKARLRAARNSKIAENEEEQTSYFREATRLQTEMTNYAAAILALRRITGK